MTQKFVIASPLYRQEFEIKNEGVQLSSQTMPNRIFAAAISTVFLQSQLNNNTKLAISAGFFMYHMLIGLTIANKLYSQNHYDSGIYFDSRTVLI